MPTSPGPRAQFGDALNATNNAGRGGAGDPGVFGERNRAIDPALYSEFAESWWDPEGFLHGIGTMLNPVRVPYIERVLRHRGLSPVGRQVLDLGCGGGLLAEPLGELGMIVTGVDASVPSVAAGRLRGEPVRYAAARAEQLPFPDDAFDVVVAMEVLEHVEDPIPVVAEASRVLRPGGVFFFAGPSRTRLSRLVLIDLAQRWGWSAVLPPGLHEWERFITPSEMSMMLADAGVAAKETTGLGVEWSGLPAALGAYRLLRRGRIEHAEAGRRVRLTTGRNTNLAFIGHGLKR